MSLKSTNRVATSFYKVSGSCFIFHPSSSFLALHSKSFKAVADKTESITPAGPLEARPRLSDATEAEAEAKVEAVPKFEVQLF